jgi:hypothetical protein
MSSLVISLQEEALAGDVPVTRLLAKAKAIAAKLNLAATTDWVASELSGYSDGAEVPDYRNIYGGFVAKNPLYGWQTIQISHPELAEIFEKRPATIPVSQLEALVTTAEGGKHDVMISISAGLANQLRASLGIPYEIRYSANGSQLVRILDAVRQRVLDWALKLESDGILGEGLSFSQEEKRRVDKGGDIYNIAITNMSGSVGPVADRASVNATQNIQGVDPEHLLALLQNLRRILDAKEFRGREYVDDNLTELEKEAASGKASKKSVWQRLSAVRGIIGKGVDFIGKTVAEHEIDSFLDSLT